MEKIELETKEIITLPKGFSARHKTDALGYTLYFGGFHCYIPYKSTIMFVQEMMKGLLLKSGMKPNEIINFLTRSNDKKIGLNNKLTR